MDKKTTRNSATITPDTVELSEQPISDGGCPLPSKATLAFIRQFARAYTYEASLGCALGGMIAN